MRLLPLKTTLVSLFLATSAFRVSTLATCLNNIKELVPDEPSQTPIILPLKRGEQFQLFPNGDRFFVLAPARDAATTRNLLTGQVGQIRSGWQVTSIPAEFQRPLLGDDGTAAVTDGTTNEFSTKLYRVEDGQVLTIPTRSDPDFRWFESFPQLIHRTLRVEARGTNIALVKSFELDEQKYVLMTGSLGKISEPHLPHWSLFQVNPSGVLTPIGESLRTVDAATGFFPTDILIDKNRRRAAILLTRRRSDEEKAASAVLVFDLSIKIAVGTALTPKLVEIPPAESSIVGLDLATGHILLLPSDGNIKPTESFIRVDLQTATQMPPVNDKPLDSIPWGLGIRHIAHGEQGQFVEVLIYRQNYLLRFSDGRVSQAGQFPDEFFPETGEKDFQLSDTHLAVLGSLNNRPTVVFVPLGKKS